ncbi:MAG: Sua5/YciO/YrdC/YwlC family protein, partial [Acidobacteriota bacterium]|nr:Sua5/YciO/YrdC/YwlC family protein [Acidobacteriota bacterium]
SAAEPLPVLVAEPSQIARWTPAAKTPGLCEIAALWPAALTLVVDIAEPIAASAGQRSLAVRVPAHARLRGLLADVDLPVTATSANRSGKPSLCDPDEVAHLLAQTDAVVIDDGPLPGGPPSTLVRYDAATAGFNVLREGAYPPHLLRNTGR